MAFIPPFPPHPPEAPGPLKMLKMARRNLLEIWPEATFHQTHFEHALFRRRIFVCNSPETVRQVFVEDAANVMRKSSQQVHALKPLIGDGLFISDGELMAAAPQSRRAAHPRGWANSSRRWRRWRRRSSVPRCGTLKAARNSTCSPRWPS